MCLSKMISGVEHSIPPTPGLKRLASVFKLMGNYFLIHWYSVGKAEPDTCICCLSVKLSSSFVSSPYDLNKRRWPFIKSVTWGKPHWFSGSRLNPHQSYWQELVLMPLSFLTQFVHM